jgi:flagellar export protein FliJ
LEWKETLEKEAWAARIALENRAEQLRREINHLRRQREDLPEILTGKGGAQTIAELSQWALYAEGLRRREESLASRLEALRPELESKIRAHLNIQREVKGLRKLEERARARHKKRVEKKQQESIDDIASRMTFPGPGTSFPDPDVATEPEEPGRARGNRRGRVSDPIRGRGI